MHPRLRDRRLRQYEVLGHQVRRHDSFQAHGAALVRTQVQDGVGGVGSEAQRREAAEVCKRREVDPVSFLGAEVGEGVRPVAGREDERVSPGTACQEVRAGAAVQNIIARVRVVSRAVAVEVVAACAAV